MIIVDIPKMVQLVRDIGVVDMIDQLIERFYHGYLRWEDFDKSARQACYVEHGVIELMPVCDQSHHAVKWINCHPENVKSNKLSIVGFGIWSEVTYGYPLMMVEMTLLTAIRTAAATGLFIRHAIDRQINAVGLVGTGAQSEFHALMIHRLLPHAKIFYYDIDPIACEKFNDNMVSQGVVCERAAGVQELCEAVDLLLTLTATRAHTRIIKDEWVKSHHIIAAIGGDAPGKTELDPAIIGRSDIVVQYLDQTQKEGEIQNQSPVCVHALHEVIQEPLKDNGRPLVFDSVGFAIEDYISMQYVWDVLQKKSKDNIVMLPNLSDPKDLFSLLRG